MARAKIIQASHVIIVLAICMIANAVQTDVSGKWEMCANTNYEFDLDLGQSGDQISGAMTRTNGNEPVDSIYGTVSSDGKITFKRERSGWVQDFTGQISSSGDSLTMDGTFAHNMAGSYPWTATRILPKVQPTLPPCNGLLVDLEEGSNSVVIAKVVDDCEHNPLKDAVLDIVIFHVYDKQLNKWINGEYVDRQKMTNDNGEASIIINGNPNDIYRVDVYASKEGWDRSDSSIHVTIE